MQRTALMFVLAAMVGASVPARAQQRAPSGVRDALLGHWNDIGGKIVTMAEDFPENKYDYKPVADVRTFADVLRHVAFWNQYVAKAARGEKPDGKQNELPKTEFAAKAAIVSALKTSLAEAAAELKKQPASPDTKLIDLYTAFIGHSGEHYGQLVVYYRLNSLVPPASRGND